MRDPRSYGERWAAMRSICESNTRHQLVLRRIAILEGVRLWAGTKIWLAAVGLAVAFIALTLAGVAYEAVMAAREVYLGWDNACWAGARIVAGVGRHLTHCFMALPVLVILMTTDTLGGEKKGFRSEWELEEVRKAAREKLAVLEEREALSKSSGLAEGSALKRSKRL